MTELNKTRAPVHNRTLVSLAMMTRLNGCAAVRPIARFHCESRFRLIWWMAMMFLD